MQLSNYIILAIIEIYVLLIIVGVVLLFHARKQRQLIRRQHEKLQVLIAQLRALKLPPAPLVAGGSTYKTHINAQLTATRNRYAGLSPTTDITTAPPPDSSLAQLALALRYKFLLAEDAAIIKGDGPLRIDWEVFEQSIADSLQATVPDINTEELANYKQRVENLEKFKQLFFDMEQQWQDAQAQAREYYNQLSMMTEGMSDPDQFIDILDRYQRVYGDIESAFNYGRTGLTQTTQPSEIKINLNPHSTEEIRKLRNVAADQHRIINQLQRKLEEAITAEDKVAVIIELQQQLQRQTRFVQESETCVKLLEEELAAAMEKVNKQQLQLRRSAETVQENGRIKEALQDFALESKSLIANLQNLEKENDILKSELQQLQAQTSANPPFESQNAVNKVQAELATLKNQYVELETKYLDLKLKG